MREILTLYIIKLLNYGTEISEMQLEWIYHRCEINTKVWTSNYVFVITVITTILMLLLDLTKSKIDEIEKEIQGKIAEHVAELEAIQVSLIYITFLETM